LEPELIGEPVERFDGRTRCALRDEVDVAAPSPLAAVLATVVEALESRLLERDGRAVLAAPGALGKLAVVLDAEAIADPWSADGVGRSKWGNVCHGRRPIGVLLTSLRRDLVGDAIGDAHASSANGTRRTSGRQMKNVGRCGRSTVLCPLVFIVPNAGTSRAG